MREKSFTRVSSTTSGTAIAFDGLHVVSRSSKKGLILISDILRIFRDVVKI